MNQTIKKLETTAKAIMTEMAKPDFKNLFFYHTDGSKERVIKVSRGSYNRIELADDGLRELKPNTQCKFLTINVQPSAEGRAKVRMLIEQHHVEFDSFTLVSLLMNMLTIYDGVVSQETAKEERQTLQEELTELAKKLPHQVDNLARIIEIVDQLKKLEK